MPKVKWIQPVKVNELAALFTAYRRARGMNSAAIAEKIGCAASTARYQMNRPGREWRVGELMDYCDALNIPYQEALEAATK